MGCTAARVEAGNSGVPSPTFLCVCSCSGSLYVSLLFVFCLLLARVFLHVSVPASLCVTRFPLSFPFSPHLFATLALACCHRLCFSGLAFSFSLCVPQPLLHLPTPCKQGGELRTPSHSRAGAPALQTAGDVRSAPVSAAPSGPGPPCRPGVVPSGAAAPGGVGPAWN